MGRTDVSENDLHAFVDGQLAAGGGLAGAGIGAATGGGILRGAATGAVLGGAGGYAYDKVKGND